VGCLGLFAPYLLLIARRSVKKCSVGSGRDTKNRLQHTSISLPQDAKTHCVGPPPATGEKRLLCLHGGGYNLPILDTHISISLKCASQASASRITRIHRHTHWPLPYTNHASHRRTKTHLITHSLRTNHHCRGISRWTSHSEFVITSSPPI
jgi:hypothetical protein